MLIKGFCRVYFDIDSLYLAVARQDIADIFEQYMNIDEEIERHIDINNLCNVQDEYIIKQAFPQYADYFKSGQAVLIDIEDFTLMTVLKDLEYKKEVKKAASALGRKGGSVKSEAKAKASAENGRKGGRPKKIKE